MTRAQDTKAGQSVKKPEKKTATVHATAISLPAGGVLLTGPSGAGKSSLAYRLIARHAARLVADDRVRLVAHDNSLFAEPPARLAGLMEVRGIGFLRMDYLARAQLDIAVELVAADAVPRIAEPHYLKTAGLTCRSSVCMRLTGIFTQKLIWRSPYRHWRVSRGGIYDWGIWGIRLVMSRSKRQIGKRVRPATGHKTENEINDWHGLGHTWGAGRRTTALEHVVGAQENLATICIRPDDDMEKRREDIVDAIVKVDMGDGVALLTDMFGGTPSISPFRCLKRTKSRS